MDKNSFITKLIIIKNKKKLIILSNIFKILKFENLLWKYVLINICIWLHLILSYFINGTTNITLGETAANIIKKKKVWQPKILDQKLKYYIIL